MEPKEEYTDEELEQLTQKIDDLNAEVQRLQDIYRGETGQEHKKSIFLGNYAKTKGIEE